MRNESNIVLETTIPVVCGEAATGQTDLCEVESQLITDLRSLHEQDFYRNFVSGKN